MVNAEVLIEPAAEQPALAALLQMTPTLAARCSGVHSATDESNASIRETGWGSNVVRNGNTNPRTDDGANRDLRIQLGHVLMHKIVRKTSQAFVLLHGEHFRLLGRRRIHDSVCDLTKLHLKTPTFTLRNRAGDAP